MTSERYLCELVSMGLVLFIGLFWLAGLIADYWVARRNEQQLLGEMEMRRGLPAAKRMGLIPEDTQ